MSPGCAHCYAARMASRFAGTGSPYEGLARHGKWTGAARFVPEMLELPLRWKKPRRVFVNSMSDLFHDDISDEQIAAVFGVMAAAPQHTFQVLTKRPERMAAWFRWLEQYVALCDRTLLAITEWMPDSCAAIAEEQLRKELQDVHSSWPLPNVWIGVSAEDQARADERLPLLLQTPAAVRWVSCEPLLGAVDLSRWVFDRDRAIDRARFGPAAMNREQADAVIGHPLDWVVVGGESGPGARPCDVGWVRSIVGQCKTAGVPVFIKQLGANAIDSSLRDVWCHGEHHYTRAPGDPLLAEATGRPGYEVTDHRLSRLLRDPSGADPSEWPSDLRVRDWPREARP